MKSFKQYIDEQEDEELDCEEINEKKKKKASKLVIANKIRLLSAKIKQANTEKEKLDLIASQNTWLAGLMLLSDQ